MRVAIIGGRGMIGNALTKELLIHDHLVTVLTRGEIPSDQAGVSFRRWNGSDPASLAEILQDQEAVVNLAGESIGKSRWSPKRKEAILSSRMEPGTALVKALNSLNDGPRTVIQASAVGYYGTGDQERNETSANGQDWLAHVCAEWEKALDNLTRKDQVRTVILRSGVVLSKTGGVLNQMVLPVRFFAGGPIGDGKQWISWIHITDEVRAIRFLLENSECRGIYNLTAPDAVNNAEMERTLCKILHRPYWLPVPTFVLKGALGEMSTLVVEGQQVLPVRLIEAGFKFDFPDLEPALMDLL